MIKMSIAEMIAYLREVDSVDISFCHSPHGTAVRVTMGDREETDRPPKWRATGDSLRLALESMMFQIAQDLGEELEYIPDPSENEALDMVNHPSHYNMHPTGIECNTIIEWFAANIATAMGYMWRAPHKGTQIQDLKKAQWHLNREIERLEWLANKQQEEADGAD